jgi:hypothetical protein
VEQDRHEVARLVAPADVAGLVLDPHAAVGGEPEILRESSTPAELRDTEARAGDRLDLESTSRTSASHASRDIPCVRANACHARNGPQAMKGFGSSVTLNGASDDTICRTWRRSFSVGVRAPPREQRADVDGVTAGRTAEPDDVIHREVVSSQRRAR